MSTVRDLVVHRIARNAWERFPHGSPEWRRIWEWLYLLDGARGAMAAEDFDFTPSAEAQARWDEAMAALESKVVQASGLSDVDADIHSAATAEQKAAVLSGYAAKLDAAIVSKIDALCDRFMAERGA
jgi:hypothetical protein